MRPHYSQSSRENATPSSGTSPLASYKEVPPPPGLKTRILPKFVLLIKYTVSLGHTRKKDNILIKRVDISLIARLHSINIYAYGGF